MINKPPHTFLRANTGRGLSHTGLVKEVPTLYRTFEPYCAQGNRLKGSRQMITAMTIPSFPESVSLLTRLIYYNSINNKNETGGTSSFA
jgi:hypothetical protein